MRVLTPPNANQYQDYRVITVMPLTVIPIRMIRLGGSKRDYPTALIEWHHDG